MCLHFHNQNSLLGIQQNSSDLKFAKQRWPRKQTTLHFPSWFNSKNSGIWRGKYWNDARWVRILRDWMRLIHAKNAIHFVFHMLKSSINQKLINRLHTLWRNMPKTWPKKKKERERKQKKKTPIGQGKCSKKAGQIVEVLAHV